MRADDQATDRHGRDPRPSTRKRISQPRSRRSTRRRIRTSSRCSSPMVSSTDRTRAIAPRARPGRGGRQPWAHPVRRHELCAGRRRAARSSCASTATACSSRTTSSAVSPRLVEHRRGDGRWRDVAGPGRRCELDSPRAIASAMTSRLGVGPAAVPRRWGSWLGRHGVPRCVSAQRRSSCRWLRGRRRRERGRGAGDPARRDRWRVVRPGDPIGVRALARASRRWPSSSTGTGARERSPPAGHPSSRAATATCCTCPCPGARVPAATSGGRGSTARPSPGARCSSWFEIRPPHPASRWSFPSCTSPGVSGSCRASLHHHTRPPRAWIWRSCDHRSTSRSTGSRRPSRAAA